MKKRRFFSKSMMLSKLWAFNSTSDRIKLVTPSKKDTVINLYDESN